MRICTSGQRTIGLTGLDRDRGQRQGSSSNSKHGKRIIRGERSVGAQMERGRGEKVVGGEERRGVLGSESDEKWREWEQQQQETRATKIVRFVSLTRGGDGICICCFSSSFVVFISITASGTICFLLLYEVWIVSVEGIGRKGDVRRIRSFPSLLWLYLLQLVRGMAIIKPKVFRNIFSTINQ